MSELVREFLSDEKAFLESNYMWSKDSLIRRNDEIPQGMSLNGTEKAPIQKKIKSGYFYFAELEWNPKGRAKRAVSIEYVRDDRVRNYPKEDLLEAYWVAYEQNKAYRAVLSGSDAKYMFTANMTGCTFARGSQSATGHIVVGHSNAIEVAQKTIKSARASGQSPSDARYAGETEQIYEQAKMLQDKLGKANVPHIGMLNPKYYAEGVYNSPEAANAPHGATYGAFVVGVFKESTWKFYCQRRIHIWPKDVAIHDVTEI